VSSSSQGVRRRPRPRCPAPRSPDDQFVEVHPQHAGQPRLRRRGALAYLAVYNTGRTRVFGHCAASTGIEPFMALVEQVMTREPYASATRVFWIVDNGSSHRGQAAIDRLAKRFPNAVMVHTPRHASWLNQIEIYFSVVQRAGHPAGISSYLELEGGPPPTLRRGLT
jgi:hypothetical protein